MLAIISSSSKPMSIVPSVLYGVQRASGRKHLFLFLRTGFILRLVKLQSYLVPLLTISQVLLSGEEERLEKCALK